LDTAARIDNLEGKSLVPFPIKKVEKRNLGDKGRLMLKLYKEAKSSLKGA